jgi:DNA-binding transcriptional regulator YiaG
VTGSNFIGAQAKLTPDDVRAIRAAPEVRASEFARRFGVSARAVLEVRQRKTWRHVA